MYVDQLIVSIEYGDTVGRGQDSCINQMSFIEIDTGETDTCHIMILVIMIHAHIICVGYRMSVFTCISHL